MKIYLPTNVKFIIDSLQKKGYEAYAVGGCVRDSLLRRLPNDWDITTSALPEEIKSLFKRTVDTGIEHGTVTVLMGKEAYEVTTFRKDNEYVDMRHPSSVDFVSDIYTDLRRRDFTINSMAYNDKNGLIDPFGGLKDLNEGIVRCVDDPFERFSEDALRILRAVRFSAQLSFSIDEKTRSAISKLSHLLKHISAERICSELIKLIISPHPEYLKEAYTLGITRVFFREFDRIMETEQHSKYHIYSVGEHSLKTMQYIEPERILRLTMLLHDIGKPDTKTTDKYGNDHFKGHAEISAQIAKGFMRRLKLDNDTIKKVTTLIRFHDWRYNPSPKNVRYAINVVGNDLFPYLIQVQLADSKAKSDYFKDEMLKTIAEIEKIYRTIVSENQCVSIKQLCINGADVLALGCPPGPKVGELLEAALKKVLDDPANNEPQFLNQYIKELLTEKCYESERNGTI